MKAQILWMACLMISTGAGMMALWAEEKKYKGCATLLIMVCTVAGMLAGMRFLLVLQGAQ